MTALRNLRSTLIVGFALVLFPAIASAATTDFRVLIDADDNAATGCTVGGMSGVDQVLITRVNTTASGGEVTAVTREVCSAGVLGAPIAVISTPYPAGFDASSGQLLVETSMPFSALVSSGSPANLRLGFTATQGSLVHSALNQPDGDEIIFPVLPGRRRSVGSTGPRLFALDGLPGDWAEINPLVNGIASSGVPGLRMIKIYAYANVSDSTVYFRFDANLDNDAPFAEDDEYNRPPGAGLSVPAPGVLANDADPNGLPLTAQPVSAATLGTVVLNADGSFTYAPDDPTSTATDQFEYKANNGSQDSNVAKVQIKVSSVANQAPVAVNDGYNTNEDANLNVPDPGVLSNDSDPDGDSLTVSLLAPPANGDVTLNPGGGFFYDPDPNFFGTDTFTYTVSDGTLTATATVTITIASVNDPPTLFGATFSLPENSPNGTVVGTLSVSDPDAGDTHTYEILSGNTGGAFAINSSTGQITVANSGALDFETNPTFNLVVQATDSGTPSESDNAGVTINLTDGNELPFAVNDAYNVNEDGTLTIVAPGVLGNDSDPEGDSLTAVLVSGPTNAASFALNADGSFNYQPAANFFGTDSFTYQANDGTNSSNIASVTITVNPVNDVPSFTAGPSPISHAADAGPYSQVWATAVSAGPVNEAGQALNFIVSNDNTALFSAQPAIAADGTLTFTPTGNLLGSATVSVQLQDNGGVANGGVDTSALVTFTIIITCPTITVTNPATTTGTAGTPFSQTFTQSGAIGGATFTTASALPTGLVLAPNGTLAGTPTQTGSFPITVTVTDSLGCTGTSPTYSLVIGCPTITVTNPANTAATVGSPFLETFTQSGAVGSATFTTSSPLPAGLTLATNGVLSGTPTQFGSFPIVVTATDSNGCTGTGATYNLVVTCQSITVTNPANNTGVANAAFSETFTQTGALGGATFTTSSTLPAGLTLATNGVLSGTPTQTGTFPIVVTVTDGNGCTGTSPTYTLTITCQTITVTNPANANGTANSPFSETFTESGAIGTATFTTSSTLPAGLTLATNGTLSGTPTQTGSFPIVVTVTDSNGCTGTGATYTLVIGCQTITVNNPANTNGTANAAFSETFTQTGAIGTATFTTSSTLPAGLTLATNGVLSGTPTETGSFPIVVTVTDANTCTGTSPTYTLVIACQTITVTNPSNTTGTVSSAFSETFTQTGAIGSATFTTASTLPAGITLATNGVLSGIPTEDGTFPIVVTVTDANNCTGISATYNLIIACQTITVTNPSNDTGPAGSPFSETFTQTGAVGTATFTTASTLPTGLTLSTAGVLSGTPTQGGTFPIVVTVTDSNGCTGTGATYTLVITCPTITVTNPVNGNGTAGTAFSETFTQTGGQGTTTFSLASGTLPAGLSLATDGTLSGTPTQTGSFPITVTATDSNGCTGTGSTYTIVIACQSITVNNPANGNGTANSAFSETFTNTGAIGAVSYTLASGTLPAGLTLATDGTLSGTPTQTGSFPITVTVTDANGCTGTGSTYTIVIACQTITVNNPANANGTVNAPFSETFTQSNGIGTTTFTLASGTLPAGLTLATDGTLSGTPTEPGSFPITVTVTDSNGCTGTGSTYTIVIACQTITVNSPANANGTVNDPFSETFTQTGATGTATFTTSSALPAGITLSTAGVLSGTPTEDGTFPIVVTVTDSNGCTGTSATYNLVIACQTITVTNPANSSGTAGTLFTEMFTQTGAVGTATFTTSSTLPAGLVLQTDGTLTGTPTDVGTFPIVVTVTDSNGCTGTGATYNLTISCQTITVTSPTPTTVQAGTTLDATYTFTATGILGTPNWTLESGTLPTGITLNASTGELQGSTTQQGSFPITVRVTDTNGCFDISDTYTLTVTCPVITVTRTGGGTFPAGVFNTPYNGESFDATGGTGPYTFAVTSGTFPTGLTLNTDGTITGTPTATGTFLFDVTATDAAACTGVASFSIAINPAPGNDLYTNMVNNTQAVVTGGLTGSPGTPFVTLSGQIDDNDLPSGAVAVTAGTFATTQGGSVSIAADGTFIYTPPVTASPLASDTFTYIITSNTGGTATPTSANGLVTLNLANRVWYVNNSNGVNGNGQSQSPFNTTSAFVNGARGGPDVTGDIIYVYFGDGTTTNQNGGVALLANEQLIGEGVALVVNTHTLVAAGSKPLLGNTTAAAVTLANGNTLRGFTATTTVGATLAGISGNALTTGPIIADVNVGPTTGAGLDLTASGTITTSLTTVAISGAGTVGINANTFGTLTIGSSVNVSGASALALASGAVSGMFNNVTATAGNVSLTGVTGTWGVTAGSITGSAAAAAFNVSGGSGNITWGPSISQALAQKVVNIAGGNSNIINFNGNVSSTGTSTGLTYTGSSGNYNLNQANTFSGSGGGITIGTSESGNITFSANTTITAAGDAFTVDGSGGAVTAAITYSGTINKASGGFLINVNNLDNPGTLSMSHAPAAVGDLLQNSATASGISIINSTSTNITINNASVTFTSTAPGFTSTNNAAGTLNLPGLALTGNGTQDGYRLSGGGIINITSGVAAPSINVGGGTGNAIDGTGFTGTLNLSNNTITRNSATAVTMDGGALNGTGNTIGTGAGSALVLTGVASGITFGSVTATGGVNGIALTNTTGTLTISGGALSGATGATFLVSGGTISVTMDGTITQATAGQAAVSVAGNHTAGTLDFNAAITATNGTGLQFSNADGTYTIDNASTALSGGARVDILAGSSGTFTFIAGMTITNPGATAFNVLDSNPNATYSGTISTNNSRPVSVSRAASGACGTILFQTGNITAASGSNGIIVNNCSSGTITFNTPSISLTTTNNQGVTMTNNSGTLLVDFSPAGGNGLDVLTTTGKAFTAVGGGAVKVVGSGNTLSTNTVGTGNTILEIDTTTVATGGVTFATVSGNGNSSITRGVYLKSAGGNGVTINGGTITNYTQKGIFVDTVNNITLSGITLTGNGTANLATAAVCGDNLNGTNTNCAAGIDLQTVTTASMTNVHVDGGVQQGINGNNVTGLTLTSVEVENAGNETNESGIQLHNLFGTLTWSAINSHDNASRQLNVQNSTSTALSLTINNTSGACTFSNTAWPGSATSAQGILFSGTNNAQMTISVQNCTIARNFGPAFQSDSATSADINSTVNGGSLIDNGQHFVIASTGNGNMTYALTNIATMWVDEAHSGVTPISIAMGDGASGVFNGVIQGNTIGQAGDANSGAPCSGCNIISVRNNGSNNGLNQVLIGGSGGGQGNTLQRSAGGGINVTSGLNVSNDSGTIRVKIIGNTLTAPDGGGTGLPITIVNGTAAADTSETCANVLNNTISGAGGSGTWNMTAAIRLRHVQNNTAYLLPGYTGVTTNTAQVQTYLDGRNTLVGGNSAVALGIGTYTNTTPAGSDCY